MPEPAPSWFSRAVFDVKPEEHVVVVQGVDVQVLRWNRTGDPSARVLLFLHGGGANCYWYSFIAPFFDENYDVLSVSLSGNGASGFRDKYDGYVWADECVGVLEHFKAFSRASKPLFVAHSMGTYVATAVLERIASKFEGVVLVDGAIRSADVAEKHRRAMVKARKADPSTKFREDGWKIRPHTTTPMSRFVLRPFQECENRYILEFIANKSIAEKADGSWTWTGDPNRGAKITFKLDEFPLITVDNVRRFSKQTNIGFVYGTESVLCDPSCTDLVRESLGNDIVVVGVPEAAHHVWLDQPLSFVSTLRTVFSAWTLHAATELRSASSRRRSHDSFVEARL